MYKMNAPKFQLLSIVLFVMVLGFSMRANADLQLLGQGTSTYGTYNLIYDTDFNITWYDYTNSLDQWQNQVNWASALSVTFGGNTYDDWRLPTIPADPYVWGYDGTTTFGYNITTNEMGHLYYTDLENIGYYDKSGNAPQTGWGLNNTGDFQNLQAAAYWSGTQWATSPTGNAIYYSYLRGYQNLAAKQANNFYGIAVMDGMAVVPEPISSTLFIVGGAILGFRRFCKKRTTN